MITYADLYKIVQDMVRSGLTPDHIRGTVADALKDETEAPVERELEDQYVDPNPCGTRGYSEACGVLELTQYGA